MSNPESKSAQLGGGTEHIFYVYEQDVEDPRFSFWIETEEAGGMALYDRPPEGAGMWLDPNDESDYDGVDPTEAFEEVVAALLGDGVDAGKVAELPPHEEYFFRVIHGTIDENPDGVPNAIWAYMHDCAEEVAVQEESA